LSRLRNPHFAAGLSALAVVVGLFAWVFSAAIFRDQVFVFRDAAHYYYPLFEFTSAQWAAGHAPLWNPCENLGMPLAANPTSSLFYPPTLVLALPIGFARAYKLYVLGHLALACWGAYRLGRHWHAGTPAAAAAALSYGFGGSVLYQYCNVVFLVGAAWLPWAVLAADRMLRRRSIRAAVALGVCLALMTLGGDPQTAYHAGLLAAMYALWLGRAERRRKRQPSESPEDADPRPGGILRRRPVLLAAAAATGFALAAVQILPSLEFTPRSTRALATHARTLWEIPRHLGRPAAEPAGPANRAATWADGLLCRRMDPALHHAHVYQFSVGPWRLAELVWPNVAGRQFPLHRRWFDCIPAEGRVWVPSLYMGLLPLVLAVGAMRPRHGPTRIGWLSWALILSLVAALGWYGPGWIVHEIWAAAGADRAGLPLGPPVGGLYWLLTLVLPGYIDFRYPAKWLTVVSLCLSMLAAAGWDRAFGEGSPRLRSGLAGLGGLSLVGLLAALAIRPWWGGWLAGVEPDGLFGPFDAAGSLADLTRAMAQTTLLCFAYRWLLAETVRRRRWAPTVALLLVAVDLGVANGWMVVCGPARAWRAPRQLAARIERDRAGADGNVPSRVYRRPLWLPPSWRRTGSRGRLLEAMQWDRDTLWPKYNLRPGIAVVEVHGTMLPSDYQAYLWYIKGKKESGVSFRNGPQGASQERVLAPLSPIGVQYAILRGNEQLPRGTRMDSAGPPTAEPAAPAPWPEDVSLWRAAAWFPRAWIVHQVEVLPPLETCDPRAMLRRTRQVFEPGGVPRDLRRTAVVEKKGSGVFFRNGPQGASQKRLPTPLPPEVCRITRYEPARVEIEVVLSRPGLVVLADQFDPGWRAQAIDARGQASRARIFRTDRVMRGVWLGAGSHRLTFSYRPVILAAGLWTSGLAWLALLAAAMWVHLPTTPFHNRENARSR